MNAARRSVKRPSATARSTSSRKCSTLTPLTQDSQRSFIGCPSAPARTRPTNASLFSFTPEGKVVAAGPGSCFVVVVVRDQSQIQGGSERAPLLSADVAFLWVFRAKGVPAGGPRGAQPITRRASSSKSAGLLTWTSKPASRACCWSSGSAEPVKAISRMLSLRTARTWRATSKPSRTGRPRSTTATSGRRAEHQLHAPRPVLGHLDQVPRQFEQQPQRVSAIGVVVDEEDAPSGL